jgi:hypothetical protein
MRRLLSIACWLALTLPAWGQSHYYVAASGSDSNSGTSESTPWAHLPEMRTFTGTYTHVSGDQFTIRGCDVWTNANFPILWTYSNTSLVRDVTWYNTANCPTGWNRPVWNAGGTVMGGTECPGSSNNYHNFFLNISASNTYWEWIEAKGLYWAGTCSDGGLITIQSGQTHTFDHFYMHGWSANHSTAIDIQGFVSYLGGSGACGSTSTTNCTWQYGVFDNSDGDGVSGGGTQSFNSMYSVYKAMTNAIKPYSNGEIGGNLITGITNSFDGVTHENCIETIQAQGNNTYYIHDNLITGNTECEGLQVGNGGEIDYVWNNIWNSAGSGNNGPQVPQSSPSGSMYFWNNTVAGGWPYCIKNAGHGSAFTGNFWAANNHCINSSAAITDGSFTAGTLTIANNIGQTPSAAAAQGFTASDYYQWTPNTNTTALFGAGVNLTSNWPTGTSPSGGTFNTNDTTYAVTEQTINGVVQAVAPGRTSVARGSTWNVGPFSATPACGPPLYPCSTRSTANPGTIAPIFSSSSPSGTVNTLGTIVTNISGTPFSTSWAGYMTINGVAYTLSSCSSITSCLLTSSAGTQNGVPYNKPDTCSGNLQNSVAYDTTLNPSPLNPITRMTDCHTFPQGKSIGNMTHSGGDNDYMSSVNCCTTTPAYVAFQANGGFQYIFSAATNSAGALQIVSPVTGPAISQAFGFSRVSNVDFYSVSSFDTINDYTINPSTNTYTLTAPVVNFFGSGICPGVTTFTGASNSILGLTAAGNRFGMVIAPGGQASGDWYFVYDASLGCSSVNFNTGQYWDFCPGHIAGPCNSSTPATGTLASSGCYGSQGSTLHGIHDAELSLDGTQVAVTITGPWTGGACAGSSIANQWSIWQVGTSGDQWACSNDITCTGGLNFGGHESVGVSNVLTPSQFGPNIRPLANTALFSTFGQVPIYSDEHFTWVHPTGDDTWPWCGATDAMQTSQGSILSPPYQQNVVMCNFPYYTYPSGALPAIFTHTYSCGSPGGANCTSGPESGFGGQFSIGYATSQGDHFLWASSMLGAQGDDNLGTPRIDAYAVALDAGTAPPTPQASTPTFNPSSGTYNVTQFVTIATASSGAIICYNTTGSPATNGTTGCAPGSTLYVGPVIVPVSETLYAVAGGTGYLDSMAGSATYTLTPIPGVYVLSPPHTGGPALSAMYGVASGFAVIIPWTADSPVSPTLGGWETSNGGCTASAGYSWTNFDAVINAQLGFGAQSAVIHLAPISSGGHSAGKNTDTPCYVFSSNWASTLSAPQLYACADSDYPGSGAIPPGQCKQGVDNSAYPVAFQTPFMTAWGNAVAAAIAHIKASSYASKIAYISVGGGTNGEWLPYAVTELETQVSPSTIAQLQNVWVNTYMSTIEAKIVAANGQFSVNQTMNGGLLQVPYTFADAAATLAIGNGFGLADQGLQNYDITAFGNFGTASGGSLTNNTYPTNDHAYNYNKYPAPPIHEFQTGTFSNPANFGPYTAGVMGSLVPLIPYAIERGGNRFELYYQDWQIAYDSTVANYANYHLAYQQIIQAILQGGASLTVTSGVGGTVTDNYQEINCATINCVGYYPITTTVTLTAHPNAGQILNSWTGACSGSGSCTVSMSSSQAVGALFSATGQAAQPSLIPGTGIYAGTTNVVISSVSSGAIICWNTTGSPQTNGLGTGCTSGTLLANGGTISVPVSETVYAVAGSASLSDSTVGSASYTIIPATSGSFSITVGVQVTQGIQLQP